MLSADELKEAIATFDKLISSYEGARDRLMQRLRIAADKDIQRVDKLLRANGRMLETLRRANEISTGHLKELEKRKA
jgi:hypothetical protein